MRMILPPAPTAHEALAQIPGLDAAAALFTALLDAGAPDGTRIALEAPNPTDPLHALPATR